MKALIKIIASLFFSLSLFSQNGAMKIAVLDKTTKEGIPFANVVIMQNGIQAAAGTTDLDGNVKIKDLIPGFYDVKVAYVNYQPKLVKQVRVDSAKTVSFEINMETGLIMLEELEVVTYAVPLIDPDEPSYKKKRWRFFKRKRELRRMRKIENEKRIND